MFVDLVREECGAEIPAGRDSRFCCPFCNDHKNRLYVELEPPYRWHCFHCTLKGSPIGFVKEYYGVSGREAIDILRNFDYDIDDLELSKFNSQYNDSTLTEEEKLLLAMYDLTKEDEVEQVKYTMPPLPTNTKFLVDTFRDAEAKPFLDYLKSRGVTAQDIIDHSIGYVKQGTVKLRSDRELTLDDHVIFITYNNAGEPVYWNTRSIHKDAYVKSFNAPNEETEYGKKNTIFNLNRAKYTDKIIINEGVFNALTCGESGVATFGKQVTTDQINLLKQAHRRNPAIKYYVFLDRDAYDQGDKLAEQLSTFSENVYLVMNPTDDDANDLGYEKVQQLIAEALPFNNANRMLYLMLSV